MVPPPARRHHQVRREPAEEVPGHLPDRLRVCRVAQPVGGAEGGRRVLVRARRAHLPRGQPAHEGVPLLGVDDRRCAAAVPRRHLSRRGLHAAADHEIPREARVRSVVHVLHLEEYPHRADGVLHGAHADRCARVHAGEPGAFRIRLVLAATLGATYGIYSGFELCENVPVRPGSEEYLDSEKYQVRVRDWDAPGNLAPLITRVNTIRRLHPALQSDWSLTFFATDNPEILCYAKSTGDNSDLLLV